MLGTFYYGQAGRPSRPILGEPFSKDDRDRIELRLEENLESTGGQLTVW